MTRMPGSIATAVVDVAATPQQVWAALTELEQIAAYMQRSRVTTTWEVGSPITWDGEHDRPASPPKAEVPPDDEPHARTVNHHSPIMAPPGEAASRHPRRHSLPPDGGRTRLELNPP